MAGELYPTNQWAAPMPPPTTQSANLPVPTGWGNRNFSQRPGSRGVPWRRYAAAVRRYKWMIAAITAAGAVVGYVLARTVKPEYETRSRIWIAQEAYGQGEDRVTPLGERQLLDASAWAELLTSNVVLDSVVQQMSLFVAPKRREDIDLFTGNTPFKSHGNLQPGSYTLVLDGNGRYALRGKPRHATSEQTLETGILGSPVGRGLGFDWTPPRLRGAREIDFNVTSLRQAAIDLAERLKVALTERSFLVLSLKGPDPERDAAILNSAARQFVETTKDIKRSKEALLAGALAAQVAEAERSLRQSEQELERFRTSTITLPWRDFRRGTVDDPATQSFQSNKQAADSLARERAALQNIVRGLRGGRGVNAGAVLAVPSARTAPELQAAVQDLQTAETELQTLRRTFTSEYPRVRALEQTINRLRTQTIPQQINVLVGRLTQQQREAAQYVSRSAGELRAIPRRALDEDRLSRTVAVNESLYTALRDRYQRARAAEASVVPDVSVLDTAVAPINPVGNTGPVLMALAILGSLIGAVLLAIVLDRVDPSFRYPEQVQELGLSMLGAVPHMNSTLTLDSADEETLKAVEAFRELRMNLRHAQPTPGPTVVTITSPGENDGKSMLASNLAIAFADAGYRTLLIDGDVRRGRLHDTFGVEQSPGLTDLLAGQARPDQIARRSTNEKLLVIPAGSRAANAPELLMSDGLRRLLLTAGPVFDVVLVDSPPLGAGADPFALGVASTNMLMVLRAGQTDRQMAAAKLDILDRLPVRVLGAVLNDIEPTGVYKYYSYLDGYAASGAQLVPVPAHAHASGAYHET
jgi:capsular exopolysaccharide synthesis family protein